MSSTIYVDTFIKYTTIHKYMFEYLIILIALLLVTLVIKNIYHIHLYHNRKERLEITGLFFIIGIIWNTFAIWRGYWIFPTGHNVN